MNQLIWIVFLTEIKLALLVSGQLSGSLRLTAGYAANAGRLEIFHNGEWGTVCDNHFDNIDATVACKELGYCSGIMHQADRISDGHGAIWLTDLNCTGSERKLLHCAYNADSTRCRHYEDVGIHCFLSCSTEEDGGLRITAGYAGHQGRLEVKYRGEWGTVCGDHFGNVDAKVACRQLGYCSGIMQPATRIPSGQGAIWLNDINCSGSESKLLDCHFNNVTYQCYHWHDIGVHCFINCTTEDEDDLRITAGYAKNQGRLEIKYRGEWGTVCGDHFGNVDAEVACRQLGYCSGIMQPATRIPSGQGAIWLNDINCSGSESKLLDCHFNNVTYQCYHWHDIGVHCFINCTTEDEGDLRITAGYAKNQGRLEIKYRGEWGTVCGDHFGNVDAEVACRQLGYCSGIMQPATRIPSGQGAIWLNDINCSGSESKLLDCHFNNVTYQCYHWHDIGVHCFINCTTEDEDDLRITAGYAKNQGRLEIKYRGEWGTVCGDHFGNVDAEVACRQLGYCSGIMQPATRIPSGQGAIWLNDINCSGSESKLLDCHFNNVTYECYHWHDIGVHCFINCTSENEGDLRISEGYAKNQGRLEIKYRGEWGTVCGDHFGNVDAEVACRQLGYCSGIMQPATRIRSGQGAIWLNDVNCSGSESKLLDCNFNNVTYQCYHWHDIGVHCFMNCTTEDEGELRINSGYAKQQGRLEIMYRGEWGTVCENHFGNVDADVACRQLGYCSGIMQPSNLIYDGKGAIWLNDVNCSGSENKLLDCNFNNVTYQCYHRDDVGIHCFLSCSTEDEGRLRIADGYAMHQGRLEVHYKGEWGTVCDNHFDDIDAEVACRQLGYCSGILQPKLLIRDGHGPIWINDVNCLGSETRLLNCIYNADTSNCRHSEDVGIHCFLNCSTEDQEDEGVTPHDNVIHPTSDVVVVIICAAVAIIGAVVLLLVYWCRRHHSGRHYEEPNNQYPARNGRPVGVSNMNHLYESIRIIEGTSNLSHLNGGYIDATHWESSSSADLPHIYLEF
ncbi:scavenger receptor cysteine-rich domain-containing protein DMBT1-like [Mytilus edulis]|uniref:scavenger receptor cysteine-rich domain-containing protein DMBT1-like n=1 Tax=Mytilus edulis TaxID=6550 RepID=UPI0039EF7909